MSEELGVWTVSMLFCNFIIPCSISTPFLLLQVFVATAARFFWELSWQVTVEATGETYRGEKWILFVIFMNGFVLCRFLLRCRDTTYAFCTF